MMKFAALLTGKEGIQLAVINPGKVFRPDTNNKPGNKGDQWEHQPQRPESDACEELCNPLYEISDPNEQLLPPCQRSEFDGI